MNPLQIGKSISFCFLFVLFIFTCFFSLYMIRVGRGKNEEASIPVSNLWHIAVESETELCSDVSFNKLRAHGFGEKMLVGFIVQVTRLNSIASDRGIKWCVPVQRE